MAFTFGRPPPAAAIAAAEAVAAAAAAAPAVPAGGFTFGAPPGAAFPAPTPAPAIAKSTASGGDDISGLAADLLKGLGNDALTDITLVGSGGGRVPAVRFILAVRSKVFERMLYGDFKESASSEVAVDYNSEVLGAVVEFCCSDDIKEFEAKVIKDANDATARKLVQVCAAAHFFDLPKLANLAETVAKNLITKRPSLSCTVYDEVGADASIEQLKLVARDIIARQPKHSLLNMDGLYPSGGGVESLSPARLRELMKDEALATLEGKTMFCALKRWSEKGVGTDEAEYRKEAAKEIATRTNLSDIAPADLLGVVLESGLVERDQIYEVVKEQINEDAVHVRGAGTSEVNGRYKRDGEHSGAPRYCKQGHWKGKNELFCLYRDRNHNGDNTWYVSIPSSTVSFTPVVFYSAQDFAGFPDGNWRRVHDGSDPAPSCHSYRQF